MNASLHLRGSQFIHRLKVLQPRQSSEISPATLSFSQRGTGLTWSHSQVGPNKDSTATPASTIPSVSAAAAAAGVGQGDTSPLTVCFSEARGAGGEGANLRPEVSLWG